jgi:protoporphyrinogen oxidase
VQSIDPDAKEIVTADGRRWQYDVLLSTMPLNHLIARMEHVPSRVAGAVDGLHWSGSHIVGVGVDRPANSTKNWIYFPEPSAPFYRVTYLSNYSPYITPEPDQTLFLTETSRSGHKPEPAEGMVDRVIDGLIATHLMDESDRTLVASTWLCSPEMSYPVPSVTRMPPSARSSRGCGSRASGPRAASVPGSTRSATWTTPPCRASSSRTTVLLGEPETVWIPRGETT